MPQFVKDIDVDPPEEPLQTEDMEDQTLASYAEQVVPDLWQVSSACSEISQVPQREEVAEVVEPHGEVDDTADTEEPVSTCT